MPDVACLMLTSFADEEALFDAVMAGAAGYVLKEIHGSDLVGAIKTVASGQSLLDPRSTAQMLARLRRNVTRKDTLADSSEQERRGGHAQVVGAEPDPDERVAALHFVGQPLADVVQQRVSSG